MELTCDIAYAPNQLAGLVLLCKDIWYYFRDVRYFHFTDELDRFRPYAVVDPVTNRCIGVLYPTGFVGKDEPEPFHAYLLRPLLLQ